MNPSDSTSLLLWHGLNFAAPAAVLALLLPLLGRLLLGRRAALLPWWGQMLAQWLMGLTVLAACFWQFGHDGQMASYAALVVGAGTLQWVLLRGWRTA
ncbi:hypothetical protein [Hylemonella gracilis]|uniref:Transmembrane protein n=1 Tax=Hylemonella gracilis ATCC 19624 TaxID=887062 RepID=F3KTE2_9BURK|nr:hypothetical protein [Hylemonella gracilis]EGI76821.1 hypothetical protein HGR_08614 [Hylemonella gracilis ATCC 19624]